MNHFHFDSAKIDAALAKMRAELEPHRDDPERGAQVRIFLAVRPAFAHAEFEERNRGTDADKIDHAVTSLISNILLGRCSYDPPRLERMLTHVVRVIENISAGNIIGGGSISVAAEEAGHA